MQSEEEGRKGVKKRVALAASAGVRGKLLHKEKKTLLPSPSFPPVPSLTCKYILAPLPSAICTTVLPSSLSKSPSPLPSPFGGSKMPRETVTLQDVRGWRSVGGG